MIRCLKKAAVSLVDRDWVNCNIVFKDLIDVIFFYFVLYLKLLRNVYNSNMVFLFLLIFTNSCCLACELSTKWVDKNSVESHSSDNSNSQGNHGDLSNSSNERKENRNKLVDKFLNAQNNGVDGSRFDEALKEVSGGKKKTHWIWYVFPIIDGLGSSSTNKKYSIKNREELLEFLRNDQLRNNLVKVTKAIIDCKTKYPERTIHDIFGYPDDLKVSSSMTLFYFISEYLQEKKIEKIDTSSFYIGEKKCNMFKLVLDIYFNGEFCEKTKEEVRKWLK